MPARARKERRIQGDGEREQQHGWIERRRAQTADGEIVVSTAWDRWRRQVREQADAPPGENGSADAGHGGHHQSFGKQLPHETAAP